MSRIGFVLVFSLLAAPAFAGNVTYVPAQDVDAAFAKGAVLYADGTNYMVHASRRDAAGEAEVHANDTDIIHVLSGTAAFVTGGSVVAARPVADDEIRGREIEGGEVRQLPPRDVIIVPAGTPHWFREVPAPFTYFVVKVR